MKLLRWIYYAVMVVSLIAGLYFGLRVCYIVFFTQLFIVIAVTAINLWTVQTFSFKQELSCKSCVKGQQAFLHLQIVNDKPIPLSLIEVHVDVVSCRENVRLVFSLAPYSGKTFEIPITTPYRGQYRIGMTKLKITDIFGLVSFPFDMRWLSYYRMRELVVLPKAQAPGAVSADIVDTKSFSDAYLKHAEQGDSISDMRLYREGDALKRIHWKKTAQQGALFVKQYEYPERERIMIVVDTATHGLKGEEASIYADTICECAASIALHCLSKNRFVCVTNSSDYGKPVECAHLSNFESLRRHLALLPFEEKTDLWGTVSRAGRRGEQSYALFILTRGADSVCLQTLEQSFSAYQSVTMVVVGGAKPAGHVHSLYMEAGCDAAESLRGLI